MATPAAEVDIDEALVRELSLSLAYLTGDDSTSMPAIGRHTLAEVLDEFS